MDDIQQDIDDGAEYAQQLNEQRRREDELLARAPKAHAELKRIEAESHESCKAIIWAVDRIFRA